MATLKAARVLQRKRWKKVNVDQDLAGASFDRSYFWTKKNLVNHMHVLIFTGLAGESLLANLTAERPFSLRKENLLEPECSWLSIKQRKGDDYRVTSLVDFKFGLV